MHWRLRDRWLAGEAAEIRRLMAALKERTRRDEESFRAESALLAAVHRLSHLLQPLASASGDLDAVRKEYLASNAESPQGWIRTPSVVLSWSGNSFLEAAVSVGGHNLNSRALRLVEAPGISEIEIVQDATGTVVRFPPSRARDVAGERHIHLTGGGTRRSTQQQGTGSHRQPPHTGAQSVRCAEFAPVECGIQPSRARAALGGGSRGRQVLESFQLRSFIA